MHLFFILYGKCYETQIYSNAQTGHGSIIFPTFLLEKFVVMDVSILQNLTTDQEDVVVFVCRQIFLCFKGKLEVYTFSLLH